MEDAVGKIRDYVRKHVTGERIWRIAAKATRDSARVTLYTPDKPERLLAPREDEGESIAVGLERGLKERIGRDVTVEVVQAPTAVARFIRISPRKVRHVVDAIRNKPVQDALAILQFVPNSAAKTVSKLIKSAVANAENNHRMDAETLEVIHVHVDEGPTLKRISPRAMGRAYRIAKRVSHITVGVAESEKPARIAQRGKGVARTVGKAPRRAGRTEDAKPKRAEKPAPAAEATKPAKTRAPRKREHKGGE